MRALAELRRVGVAEVLRASVTPLASIFGSGFLIIVPLLERSMGKLAVVGVAVVVAVAWLVGTAIRHNVAAVEERIERGELSTRIRYLERLGDVVIALAYVISVALYLRIMAAYTVRYVSPGAEDAAQAMATGAMAIVVAVGVFRGFHGLDFTQRVALIAVLVLTTALGLTFFGHDVSRAIGGDLRLPPLGGDGAGETLLLLGGMLICVQGFETVRYLGDEYDRPTRIWASRVAQAVAASIYLGFVLVATPLMGLGTAAGADLTMVDFTERIAPLLTLPLVLGAILSQFSAAIADTAAATENPDARTPQVLDGTPSYLISGAAAVVMIWAIPLLTLVTVASRAFAAYYLVQCVIAVATSSRVAQRFGFGSLAAVMAAIALFAQPVG